MPPRVRVTRTQWPVGQGCFATGYIVGQSTSNGPEIAFNYVYDCGARSRARVNEAVRLFARETPNVDALFVSHFDDDHVQGLDRLLAECRIDSVYIPYVDQKSIVLDIIDRAVQSDVIPTTTTLQAALDPESWFTSRGAGRVIRIGRGPGWTPGDGPVSPREPPPPGESIRRLDTQSKGLPLTVFGTPRVHAEIARQDDPNGGRDQSVGNAEYVSGMAISLSDGLFPIGWQLIPYVHPLPQVNYARFRHVMRKHLRLKPRTQITAAFLLEKLRTEAGRKAIRACYDALIPYGASREHNRISMSLYSGPLGGNAVHWSNNLPSDWYINGVGGWIGTGDAKLKISDIWTEWSQFYGRQLPETSTLLLPHHGSNRNFHPELANLSKTHVYIAAADPRGKGYNHPSSDVVLSLMHSGKQLVHVERDPRTIFVERIEVK